jgi:hypothetical protein
MLSFKHKNFGDRVEGVGLGVKCVCYVSIKKRYFVAFIHLILGVWGDKCSGYILVGSNFTEHHQKKRNNNG